MFMTLVIGFKCHSMPVYIRDKSIHTHCRVLSNTERTGNICSASGVIFCLLQLFLQCVPHGKYQNDVLLIVLLFHKGFACVCLFWRFNTFVQHVPLQKVILQA